MFTPKRYSENHQEETSKNTKVNGETINNIRYADETVIVVSNTIELQHLVERIQRSMESI